MNRTPALSVALVALVLLVTPNATAQANQYGSIAGDAGYLEDGKECFDAIKFDPATGVGADGETSCVVLYGHLFNLLDAVPINIQRPIKGSSELARGFTGVPNIEPYWDLNQLTLYSSPGFVEYKTNDPTAEPRLHPERGLTGDVMLSRDTGIVGYWYLSADTDEVSTAGGDPPEPANPDVGVMPCLTVRMVLQPGRIYGSSQPLAEGQVTKTIINAKAAGADGRATDTGQTNPCPGSDGSVIASPSDVTEFKIQLSTASGDIPKIAGFLVYVEWYQFSPDTDPDSPRKFGQQSWNVHGGDKFLNRIVIPVKNGVRIDEVRPQFFANKIYIHGVFNSPWGSYDVDTDSIMVRVLNAAGEEVATSASDSMEPPILRYSVDHDGHFKPVNATFPWDFQADNLPVGEYTIEVSTKNWQHTATAVKTAKVIIGEKITTVDSNENTETGKITEKAVEESPVAFFVPSLVLALAGLALLRRRR